MNAAATLVKTEAPAMIKKILIPATVSLAMQEHTVK